MLGSLGSTVAQGQSSIRSSSTSPVSFPYLSVVFLYLHMPYHTLSCRPVSSYIVLYHPTLSFTFRNIFLCIHNLPSHRTLCPTRLSHTLHPSHPSHTILTPLFSPPTLSSPLSPPTHSLLLPPFYYPTRHGIRCRLRNRPPRHRLHVRRRRLQPRPRPCGGPRPRPGRLHCHHP